MMHRDNRDRKGKMRIVLQKFSPRRAIFLSAGAFISADYIWDVPWQCAKETHKTHACIFLFCHMMLNGIHSHCLFGFTHQFDMLLVEGYTNLEEVSDALLLHRYNISLLFDLCQGFLSRSFKLTIDASFGNAVL